MLVIAQRDRGGEAKLKRHVEARYAKRTAGAHLHAREIVQGKGATAEERIEAPEAIR